MDDQLIVIIVKIHARWALEIIIIEIQLDLRPVIWEFLLITSIIGDKTNLDSRTLFLSHRGSAIRGFTGNKGRKSDVKGADDGKRRERAQRVHQIFESEKKISPGVEVAIKRLACSFQYKNF